MKKYTAQRPAAHGEGTNPTRRKPDPATIRQSALTHRTKAACNLDYLRTADPRDWQYQQDLVTLIIQHTFAAKVLEANV